MEQKQRTAALQLENEKLGKENDQLRVILSLVKENQDLRTSLQSFNDKTQEQPTVCSASGTKSSALWHTFDEEHFTKPLQKSQCKYEHRTSSPVNFKSFIQSTMHTNPREEPQVERCQGDCPSEVKDSDRFIGEIAYQLDRRILSHVFQGQIRLYGFTVLNIPEKIIEVSTHPLTGKLDEGYRVYLTQRYTDLMEQLTQLGYKAKLHPAFIEFIVNTYGILKEKPDEYINYAMEFNSPEFLKKLIMTRAPEKLQKDLQLVLTCLCNMAEKDGKPLLLW